MNSFYLCQGAERYRSLPSTAGPWNTTSQHGGPPAALLTRAIERLAGDSGRMVGRLAMDLLGPIPVGPLRVSAAVIRQGRSVQLCEAGLYDETRDRPVATARAWMFPARATGPEADGRPLPHTPDDGVTHPIPASWSGGYLDAVEWRWVHGAVEQPGPGVVWMRPRVDLVDGEQMSPIQRLMACVDSASGVSAALDPAEWGFLNTELTVHVLRPPVGEWICLDARTTLSCGAVGMATADVYDSRGLVGRSAQALLIASRG